MKDKTNQEHRWLFIANPQAGNGRCERKLPSFLKICTHAGVPFELNYTIGKAHAAELATEGVKRGFRKILVLGGDGALHETVNGLLKQTEVDASEILLASAPMGSANDWARFYGFTKVDKAFVKVLLKEKFILQDVGQVTCSNDKGQSVIHYFINVLGIGYDSFVATQLEASGKGWWPAASYLWKVFKCLWSYRAAAMYVETDLLKSRDNYFTVNAGITKYSGNGMQLVAHANPVDDMLAITIIEEMSPLEVIVNMPKLYRGTLERHSSVHCFQSKQLIVQTATEAQLPVAVEADGELLGFTPVTVQSLPARLKVLVK